MLRFSSFFHPVFRGALSAVAIFASLGTIALRGDETSQPTLSEETADGLQKLQPLADAGNWDGILTVVEPLLAKSGPQSFDRAFLLRLKGQALYQVLSFQKKDVSSAIAPFEESLTLSDTYHFFSNQDSLQLCYILSNLYYQRAADLKNDQAGQDAAYQKAREYIERWLKLAYDKNSKVKASASEIANAEYFYASLLFTEAQKDPKHTDESLIKKALVEVDRGMRVTIKPSDDLYVLKLAGYQQLNDATRVAEILEHLLKTKPDNKSYWQALVASYINLASKASESKNEEAARQYNIRAILAMERAQKNGAMNTPADNYTFVSLYYNVGQYEKAAELLRKGLRDKTIEPTLQHWKFLAQIYQLTHKDLDAVEVLTEASESFPDSGQLDFQAAQILYSLDKTSEALAAIQRCVGKDGGDQPVQSWIFEAYLAFELQKLELAGQAVENAAKLPGANPKQIADLRAGVKEAIRERDAAVARSQQKQNL